MKKKISITIDETVLKEIDNTVDNVYIRNRSQAIETLVRESLGGQKTAVILAGGPEKRLERNGDFMIGVKISQKTLLEHTVNKLRRSGFKNLLIVGRNKILTRAFEILRDGASFGVNVTYIEEKVSKGTATTLRLVKGKVHSSFLVVYGDLYFSQVNIGSLWDSHIKYKPVSTLMITTSAKPSEKGTVTMEGSKVLQFVQKPKKSEVYLVFSPIFAAEPELLDYTGKSLEKKIFPKLAEKGFLRGFVSAEKEVHIHKIEDVKNIKL
ncbi:MAG: Bifunctional protein GlmU [Candidatus Woesearchaeota archaeon]|nr:Bifunctional protein GlmU [Candidatus Woesearchaeota archaeon]